MIEGLDGVLAGSGQPGVAELRALLEELLAHYNGSARWIDQEPLEPRGRRVFRLRFAVDGGTRSLVIKRHSSASALRNELVVRRWLPAIGLNGSGTPLLGSVAARSGDCVWHVYDDLGPYGLDPLPSDRERVGAAIEMIARIHTCFGGHPLMGEIRLHGGDRGIRFYESNVRDAIHGLEAWQPAEAHHEVLNRLLARLYRLRDELPRRASALASLELPDTLLHGDLWGNVFVIPTADGPCPRLIDWDHSAAGPFTYDLSTLLWRSPEQDRPWMLELYREAVAQAGWRLPPPETLNLLFETHEYARCANKVIWPAIATVIDKAEWGFEMLAEVDRWFEALKPVLGGENG